ncbi:MAG TPA: hypothetical protein PKX04_10740 [Chitinophagales bacterium]|nr:hypothetical protein [Chitinophagales bacterium]HPE98426.1 hypothetical protein [Chitinophagales bacterium]HRX23665.1 hypothetical protein [Chitinophagales bacterium]
MIYISLIFLLLISTGAIRSQIDLPNNVESSVFGVQTGLVGIWGYHELGLNEKWVLRSEIGLDASVWAGHDKNITILSSPVMALDARWYYNIQRRAEKGKSTSANAADFLTVRTAFHLQDRSNMAIHNLNQPFIALAYGLKRNLGMSFNYELGLGGGLGFGKENIIPTPYLHARIGWHADQTDH